MLGLGGVNDDVAYHICSFLSHCDAAQLALTCKRASALTIPTRLHSLRLVSAQDVLAFCSLVSKDSSVMRCFYVRSLRILDRRTLPGMGRILHAVSDILLHCYRLETLHLEVPNVATAQYGLLHEALDHLSGLKNLSLSTTWQHLSTILLGEMTFRPHSVAFADMPLRLFRDPGFCGFLSNVETLEFIHIASYSWSWPNPPVYQEVPSVRTLIIPMVDQHAFTILSRIFPRARHLRCRPCRRKQAVRPLDVRPLIWNDLDTVHCGTPPSLAIQIRAVHLTMSPNSAHRGTPNMRYAWFITTSRPSVLVCFMEYKFLRSLLFWPIQPRYISLYQHSKQELLDKNQGSNVASRLMQYAFVLLDLRYLLVGVCFHYNARWLEDNRAEQFSEDALQSPAMKLAKCIPTLTL